MGWVLLTIDTIDLVGRLGLILSISVFACPLSSLEIYNCSKIGMSNSITIYSSSIINYWLGAYFYLHILLPIGGYIGLY
jgi:hypothetical protein